MITLVPTFGSMTANCYVGLADANAIIVDEVLDNLPWTDASSGLKATALVQAARYIDAYNYAGTRYFYKQAMAFPRVPQGLGINIEEYGPSYGSSESDGNFFNFLEQDQFLQRQQHRVIRANCIQAIHLLRNRGRNLERETQFQGIGSLSTGAAGISESQSYAGPAHRLHPDALDLLRYYRLSPRLVRGSGPDPAYE